MIKKFLITTISALVIIITQVRAQETEGIRFEQKLKWSEILAKAKAEHKYVFVDCYATWCGPCKLMEQTVYPQKEVGEAYKDYICVKIQMDKTAKDDSLTKSRYSRAEMFEKNYTVNAYPTFLFFDPNGNPVHKVTGAMDAKAFVQHAKDAQNPDKQYYAILKNFQPGKLDTEDEKGLAFAFLNSDKELAGKIAGDYLSRIPESRLDTYDSGRLMVWFQDNPQVLGIALSFIKSFSRPELTQNNHVQFIKALSKQQPVMDFVVAYIKGLSNEEMEQPANLGFVKDFADRSNTQVHQLALNYIRQLDLIQLRQQKNLDFISAFRFTKSGLDPCVKQVGDRYINSLPQDSLCSVKNFRLVYLFTRSTADRGFNLFYRHYRKVDLLLQDERFGLAQEHLTAHGIASDVIAQIEWDPLFSQSKQTGKMPNFHAIYQKIVINYNRQYADEIVGRAKVDYFSYLVIDKKQDCYWPQLNQTSINRDKKYLTDQTAFNPLDVNNDCWNVYLHSDDPEILGIASSLITKVVKEDPYYATLDTYASLLYKRGKAEWAISEEEQALKSFDNIAHPIVAKEFRSKIEAMKRGEKVWLEKNYQ